ncbi:MAG: DUF6769 family protein [Bacteroidales bacterium]|nr:DUF6769 family protein [Bacteroidales bacterium]
MKKAFAIFLMMGAILILLAHAVIPHHHHNDIACFALPTAGDHDHQCEHHDAGHQHRHSDGQDTDTESCSLNDLLVIIPDSYRQEMLLAGFSQATLSNALISASSVLTDDPEVKNFDCSPFRQKPYLQFSYTASINACSGLRAPPNC